MRDRVIVKPTLAKKHKGRFPKHIKLAGMKLPLHMCDKIDVVSEGEEGLAHGAYNGEQGWIFLDNKGSDQFTQETLMHECVHAIDALYKLDLSEAQVRYLSMGINNLIRSNPIFRRQMDE